MANCVNCSAPLPPDSIRCEYCGSINDTDLRGIHTFTTEVPESQRICPRCSIPLRTIDLKVNGRFLIERCDQCMGLFFDPGELEALLDASVQNVYTINLKKLDRINETMTPRESRVVYVRCPVCREFMNRVSFGTKSGVIVDRCRDHGIWLNGGELRHLFEWRKAGGKLLHEQRVAEKEELERREKEKREQERKDDQGRLDHSGYLLSGTHSYRERDEIDLVDIFRGIASWLL